MLYFVVVTVFGWRSAECPIESQDVIDRSMCIRPCDFDDTPGHNQNIHNRNREQKATNSENFFIIFFPPKNKEYEESRFKCPSGFKQTIEARRCFCERPFTNYELEMQQREKCDSAFEKCRMYGSKPYDCNHIIGVCPQHLIRDYCIAGKVFKMRFATVVYEFCHAYLKLLQSGKRPHLEPDVNY